MSEPTKETQQVVVQGVRNTNVKDNNGGVDDGSSTTSSTFDNNFYDKGPEKLLGGKPQELSSDTEVDDSSDDDSEYSFSKSLDDTQRGSRSITIQNLASSSSDGGSDKQHGGNGKDEEGDDDDNEYSSSVLQSLDFDKAPRGARTIQLLGDDDSDDDSDNEEIEEDSRRKKKQKNGITVSRSSVVQSGLTRRVSVDSAQQHLASPSSAVRPAGGTEIGRTKLRRSAESLLSLHFSEVAKENQERKHQQLLDIKRKEGGGRGGQRHGNVILQSEKYKRDQLAEEIKSLEKAHQEQMAELKKKLQQRDESIQELQANPQAKASASSSVISTAAVTENPTTVAKRPLNSVEGNDDNDHKSNLLEYHTTSTSRAGGISKRQRKNSHDADVAGLITRISSSNLMRSSGGSGVVRRVPDVGQTNASFDPSASRRLAANIKRNEFLQLLKKC